MEGRQALAMEASPALLAFAELLALPAVELEQRIERELAANPALERAESTGCPWCGDPAGAGACGTCGSGVRPGQPVRPDDGDEPDASQRLADQPTVAARLLAELRQSLPARDHAVAEAVAGSLNRRGLLAAGPDELATQLGVGRERVEGVLAVLREVGPPGTGARDVRECLLLQLAALDRAGDRQPHARAIVEWHLDDLARGRLARIARALGVAEEEVRAAHGFIRRRLSPSPLDGMDAERSSPAPQGQAVRPDAVIRERPGRPGELEVEVLAAVPLTVDPLYRRLAAEAGSPDRGHARPLVERADAFLSLLERRSQTLRRVVACLAERQAPFVRQGPRLLRPLSRADVARDLGVHESTVSRAAAGKFVVLPSGRLSPLHHFFQASLGLEDALRAAVAGEERALSDRELSLRLRDIGYPVARRTVAKYRSRLGLPAFALR